MTVMEAYSLETIKFILGATFTGSMLSLFLFLLKPLIKDKLPKSFQYYMWLAAVTALILPVSEILAAPVPRHLAMPAKSIHEIARQISGTAPKRPVNFPDIAVVLSVIWHTGMLLVLGFHIISYVSYVRKLGRHNRNASRPETELLNALSGRENALRLYKNSIVETPILIGLFRPAVILPDKEYDAVRLRNILLHEIAHWKKHDIFLKWLSVFVGAAHWFNPLVYLVRREMNRACELACDESVIKGFGLDEMQQYGDTLIAVAADSIRKEPLSIAMFEDKKNLKERLGAIMEHRQYAGRTVAAASAVLAAVLCVVLGVRAFYCAESRYDNMDNYSLQEQMEIKQNELAGSLCNYDKENILRTNIYLDYSEDEITKAYIAITGQEKNPDSEMLNEMISFSSKELGLDIQNICLDYVDSESLTVIQRIGE